MLFEQQTLWTWVYGCNENDMMGFVLQPFWTWVHGSSEKDMMLFEQQTLWTWVHGSSAKDMKDLFLHLDMHGSMDPVK
jgi:hypothetical protein